jgi:photosystem II stability/assembly factor-like uncharacterized protein
MIKVAQAYFYRVQRKKSYTFAVLSVVLIILSMLLANVQICVAQSTVLFNDGFETGDFSNWTGTSGNYLATTNQALKGGYSANFTTLNLDLNGVANGQSLAYKNGLSFTDSIDVNSSINFEGNVNSMPHGGVGELEFNQLWDGGSKAIQGSIGFNSSGTMCWGLMLYTGSGWVKYWGSQVPNSQSGFFPTFTTFVFDLRVTSGQANLYVNDTNAVQVQAAMFASPSQINAYIGTIENYAPTDTTYYTQMIVDDVIITTNSAPEPTPTPTQTPTPTPSPNPIGTTYLNLQITMTATVSDLVSGETSVTMPIQDSRVASDGTLYAGSNETLYKSLDQGVTWQSLITFNGSTPVGISRIYVNKLNYVFTSPSTSASYNELGLWRSTDNGQSWSQVLSLPPNCESSSIAEDSNGNLFMGVYTTGDSTSNARIYRSTDGGLNWVSVYYDSSARHVHCVTVDESNNYIYASIGDLVSPWNIAYVLRSTDGGNTWSQILPGMEQIIAIEAVPGARLFATDSATDGKIYRTTDDINYNLVLDTGAQSYGYWIRTNDINGNIYASFIGGEHPMQWVAGIWVSTNQGESWSVYKTFPIHNAYYGSGSASNFFEGTMYYCVQLDSGWENGTRLYSSSSDVSSLTENALAINIPPQIFYNEDNATLGNDGLNASSTDQSQLSLNAGFWLLLSLGAVEVSTVLSIGFFVKKRTRFSAKSKNLDLMVTGFSR